MAVSHHPVAEVSLTVLSFCVGSKDSTPDHLVFNRTATLKDTLAKIEKRGG